jgi:hypothetical protein
MEPVEEATVVGRGGLQIQFVEGSFRISDEKGRILLKPKANGTGDYIVGRIEGLNPDALDCMKKILATVCAGEGGITDHEGKDMALKDLEDFIDFHEEEDEFCG